MLPFYRRVSALSQAKVTGLGLSVFRIFISVILLVEVGKLFYFRHLYFDPVPYLVEGELSFSLVLVGWMFILVFGLLIGFKTRTAAIVNYVLVLVFFSSFTSLKYHFDSALIGISFLLIILPVSTRLSIDNLCYKLRTLNEKEQKVRKIYYYFPVILVLGLEYLDSFFHKSASITWLNGLGVWLPASLPNQVYTNQSWLLNQKEVIMSLGYLVLLFEAGFFILLLVKKARIWLVVVGICMHLGIAFVFPIPTFGVTFSGLYMLLIPITVWTRLANKRGKSIEAKPILLFCSQSPLAYRLKIFIQYFDVFHRVTYKRCESMPQKLLYVSAGDNRQMIDHKAVVRAMNKTLILLPFSIVLQQVWLFGKVKMLSNSIVPKLPDIRERSQRKFFKIYLIYFFILYLFVGQFIKTLNSPVVIKLSILTGFKGFRDSLETFFFPVAVVNTKLLGITENLVYTGFAEGPYGVLAIQYVAPDGVTVWLPLNERNGMAAPMHFGRIGPITQPNDEQLTYQRLTSITSFWAYKHNISLDEAKFIILEKKIDVLFSWEKDHLNKQLAKPWQQVGQLIWKENEPFLVL